MSVSPIAHSPQVSPGKSTPIKGSKLTSSDFIKLMAVQLKNQNPTKPTDPNEFMKQLLSVASYETQVETSKKLDAIASDLGAGLSGNGLGYIGRSVEVEGGSATLQSGKTEWTYTPGGKAKSVTLKVLDENGRIVFEKSGSKEPGKQSFSWDGKDKDGKQLPDGGKYTLKIEAAGEDGEGLSSKITSFGKVTGVDSSGEKPVLMMGKQSVAIDSVLSVRESK